MTKMLCPVATCMQSSFGVANTHQLHVEAHALSAHGIRVTSATRTYWRSEQDRVWKAKFDKVELELEAAASRHRRRMLDRVESDLPPIDMTAAQTLETLQALDAELEAVDSDGEENSFDVRKASRATANILHNDSEPDEDAQDPKNYSKSLRHYQIAEGRAKAWMKRESSKTVAETVAEIGDHGVEIEVEDGDYGNMKPAEKVARFLASAKKRERQAIRLMVDDAASRVAETPRPVDAEGDESVSE